MMEKIKMIIKTNKKKPWQMDRSLAEDGLEEKPVPIKNRSSEELPCTFLSMGLDTEALAQ